jgi:hypothetical protein
MAYGTVKADVLQSDTAGTPPQFNDGNGTQTGTLCRAWVNFNGSGGISVRGSFNVGSVTRNSAGDYSINFTTALSDANYSTVALGSENRLAMNNTTRTNTSSVTNVLTRTLSDVTADSSIVNVSVFR